MALEGDDVHEVVIAHVHLLISEFYNILYIYLLFQLLIVVKYFNIFSPIKQK